MLLLLLLLLPRLLALLPPRLPARAVLWCGGLSARPRAHVLERPPQSRHACWRAKKPVPPSLQRPCSLAIAVLLSAEVLNLCVGPTDLLAPTCTCARSNVPHVPTGVNACGGHAAQAVLARGRAAAADRDQDIVSSQSQSQSQFIKDKRIHVNTRNIQRQLYPCTATAEVD